MNITVSYLGSDVYIGNSSSVEVTPTPIVTSLVLNSTGTVINGTGIVGVNVTDANGSPVNGTVELNITDTEGNNALVNVTVTDGLATYDYTNTTVGKNVTVTGRYLENSTLGYLASEENVTEFNVAKINTTITVTPLNIVSHNESSVLIHLVNQTGGNLTGEEAIVVVIQSGDMELNSTTITMDGEGNAIVTFIPVNTEPIIVTAVYEGSKVYNDSETVDFIHDIGYIGTYVELTSENTTINGTSVIRVTVLDDNNNPVNCTVE